MNASLRLGLLFGKASLLLAFVFAGLTQPVDARSRSGLPNSPTQLSAPAEDFFIKIVSVNSNGEIGNQQSRNPSISADGRYTTFSSDASNLVENDTNGHYDVFVHDLLTGITERVSVSSAGEQGNMGGSSAAISADGRYVAFESYSNNLVAGDTNQEGDVFVHDRELHTTERVSVASNGEQANGPPCVNLKPSLSSDGRYIGFCSIANNLVPGETTWKLDVFIHDRQTGTTTKASVNSQGEEGNNWSDNIRLSGDGRFAVFISAATNLSPDGYPGIFLHDNLTGETRRIDLTYTGEAPNDSPQGAMADISADGRYIVYSSSASNLIPGDENGVSDIFRFDLLNNSLELITKLPSGVQANDRSNSPSVSADGQVIVFESWASNLVEGDNFQYWDIFKYERGSFLLLDKSATGEQADWISGPVEVADDGSYATFESWASNLVPGDTNNFQDIFVVKTGHLSERIFVPFAQR